MTASSPIFVVGCPRSGTSLLRDLLRSHPNLSFPPESHFVPRFYRGYGDPASERESRRLAHRILRVRWVRGWGLGLDAASFAHHRSYADLVDDLFGRWAAHEGKPRWGDKTPRYVLAIPTLLEVFPDARVIHIHRDGRDVALSWMRMRWGPTNLYTAARAWAAHVTAGVEAGERAGPASCLDLPYERLVSEPRAEMARVCEFVGEQFGDEVLTPSRRPRVVDAPLLGRHRGPGAPPATVDPSRAGGWRTAMSAADRALFESVAGAALERLGYERTVRGTGPGRLARAAWGARDATAQLLTRANSTDALTRLETNLRFWSADLRARARA
jgi:hypothetical protein